jgi:hypothetical protein
MNPLRHIWLLAVEAEVVVDIIAGSDYSLCQSLACACYHFVSRDIVWLREHTNIEERCESEVEVLPSDIESPEDCSKFDIGK